MKHELELEKLKEMKMRTLPWREKGITLKTIVDHETKKEEQNSYCENLNLLVNKFSSFMRNKTKNTTPQHKNWSKHHQHTNILNVGRSVILNLIVLRLKW